MSLLRQTPRRFSPFPPGWNAHSAAPTNKSQLLRYQFIMSEAWCCLFHCIDRGRLLAANALRFYSVLSRNDGIPCTNLNPIRLQLISLCCKLRPSQVLFSAELTTWIYHKGEVLRTQPEQFFNLCFMFPNFPNGTN